MAWPDQTFDLDILYSVTTYIAYAPFVSNTLDVYRCFCVTGGVCLPSHTRYPTAAACDSPPAHHPRPAPRPARHRAPPRPPACHSPPALARDQAPAHHPPPVPARYSPPARHRPRPPPPARHRAPPQPSSCHSPSGP